MDTLKPGTAWTEIEVVSEADVVPTFRGYAPVLEVKALHSGLVKRLFITAKSLCAPLEELRAGNNGRFQGLRLRIRKESEEQMAKYVVERL